MPSDLPVESIHLAKGIWQPDEHCKLANGNRSTFCPEYSSSICGGQIYCSNTSSLSSLCSVLNLSTVEGTICGSGKLCKNGECTPSSLIDDSSPCPFGDTSLLPNIIDPLTPLIERITCSQALSLITSLNRSVEAYCSDSYFSTYCCQTCQSKPDDF
jgi:hypothetical protein